MLFPKTYAQFGELVEPDAVLGFEGRFDMRGNDCQVIVDSVKPVSLEQMIQNAKERDLFDPEDKIVGVQRLELQTNDDSDEATGPYIIQLEADTDLSILKKIKPLLEARQGDTPVEIHIPSGDRLKRVKVPFGVRVDDDLKKAIRALVA